MMPVTLLLLAWIAPAQAALTFLTGPLQNATYTVVPISRFIGPQHGQIQAEFVALPPTMDPCAPGDISGMVSGKVVVIAPGACSPERQYDSMVGNGAAAIISTTLFKPGGVFANLRDGAVRSPNQDAPYVELTFSPELLATFIPGPAPILVALAPDPNPWLEMYDSAPYQLQMRYLPALLFAAAALLSAQYLVQHMSLLRTRFYSNVPAQLRTPSRIWTFAVENVTSLHFALALQTVKTATVAVARVLGGYFSSDMVSGPVQRFFMQELSGYTLITIQIVSAFWNHIRQSVSRGEQHSVLVRVLTGEYRALSALWYLLVIINELSGSILMATYAANQLSLGVLIVINIAVVLGILLIGLQFVVSVIRFWLMVRSTSGSAATDAYVARMSRLVIGLGLTQIVSVAIRVLSSNPDTLQPGPFFAIFMGASWAHAISCILVAQLLQPRPKTASGSEGTGTSGRVKLTGTVGRGGGTSKPIVGGDKSTTFTTQSQVSSAM